MNNLKPNTIIKKLSNITKNKSLIIHNTIDDDNKNIFNNNFILSKIKENNISKETNTINELKKIIPLIDNNTILQLYNTSISIHQNKMQKNGNFLEKILIDFLEKNNISYKTQVSINESGIIIGINEKVCYHIIDFVIGSNIEINKSITDYTVISCKTTCRERWTQDDWTFTLKPKLYILLTTSNDYPSSVRFREDTNRKIITCSPKKKDNRKFKLNFENLINEL